MLDFELVRKHSCNVIHRTNYANCLIFSTEENEQRGNFYCEELNLVNICQFTLSETLKEQELNSIEPAFFIEAVAAHEFGHGEIKNYRVNTIFSFIEDNLLTLTKEKLTDFFFLYKKNVINTEINAWKKSRLFLEKNYDKKAFYTIFRFHIKKYDTDLDAILQQLIDHYEL